MNEPKTLCHTPTAGAKPVFIPTWKYQAMRKAILDCVPPEPPGIPLKELPLLVQDALPETIRDKLGSVTWHLMTVKLDMETRGELQRHTSHKIQHLSRKVS